MLTNLLPGFRQLRAPLAAGYLWLMAAWLLWAPACEDSELATSVCRLNSVASDFGIAALVSFAAYLLGALSIAFCSAPLRRWLQVGGVNRREHFRPVSARAERYLQRLASESVDRMALALAFTDTSVKDVLDELLDDQAPRPSRRRRRRAGQVPPAAVLTADSPAPPPHERVERDRLVAAVARELDDIVLTRLLGHDPEFFSAIDRHRGEVEFRLAVIPPLLALVAAVATHVNAPAATALVVGGLLVAAGLAWDALTSQRQANDELAVALADARVSAPALVRVEAEATARTERTRLEEMRAAAGEAINALRSAIVRAEELDSAPSRLHAAKEAVRDAQGYLTRVEATMPSAVGELGARAVEEVDRAVQMWENPRAGDEPTDRAAESRRLVGQSKRLASDFRDAVLKELESVKSSAGPKG